MGLRICSSKEEAIQAGGCWLIAGLLWYVALATRSLRRAGREEDE